MNDGPARRVAEQLEHRGLAVPARLLVDAHRPLAPLLSDLGAALGPLVGVPFGRATRDLRSIVEDPDGMDRLAEELAGGARADAR